MADDEPEIDLAEIAARFLAQTPPLQFPPVLDDVKTIIDDAAIIAAVAPKARKLYNHEQMASLIEDGTNVIISDYNEVAPNEYLEADSAKVYTVEHMTKEIKGSRDATDAEMGGSGDLRAAISKATNAYATKTFDPNVATGVFVKGGAIVICISVAEFNAKNMWSGRWRSVWTCTVVDDEIMLKGEFKVHVHFYEDGNVQSKSEHTVETSIVSGSPEESAEAIIEEITKEEGQYQAMLDGTYVNFQKSNSIMNGLRRPMPIDKKLVDFRSIALQGRLAGQLR